MTRPPDKIELTNLIAGYALGNLNSEEMEQFRLQIAGNLQLFQELVAFQEALSLLAYVPTSDPPAHLKRQMLTQATASRQPVSTQPAVSTFGRHASFSRPARFYRFRGNAWVTRTIIGIPAAAISALGLTQLHLHKQNQQIAQLEGQMKTAQIGLYRIRQTAQTQQQLVPLLGQSETQVYELVGANPEQAKTEPLRASLLAQLGTQDVVLVTQDLPQLQANQIYRLWAVADATAAAGNFVKMMRTTIRWTVPNAVCIRSPEQLLVTLDAPEDPITSAGSLVMQSQT